MAAQHVSAAIAMAALAALPATLRAGPVWDETNIGDAGATPPGAQIPFGFGALERIEGSLAFLGPDGNDFEDMYIIRIVNGCQFSAQTFQPPGGADFDTQLWLFDLNGFGRVGNDDANGGTLQSLILADPDDGTILPPLQPGIYALAISGFNNDPLSATGPIFDQVAFTEISGPDGLGGADPIIGWQVIGGPAVGSYQIALTGVEFVGQPPCPDTNFDQEIDVQDMVAVILDWECAGLPFECRGDVNGDGIVDVLDLIEVILQWGPCPEGPFCEASGCAIGGEFREPEPCGEQANDGCQQEPPMFVPTICCDAWCGTVWATDGAQDTDWYIVDVDDPDGNGMAVLRPILSSEFDGQVQILGGFQDCNPFEIGVPGFSFGCIPQFAQANVPAPGQYVIVVQPNAPTGLPCGGGNAYRLEIQCLD